MSHLAILCPGQGDQHPGMFERLTGHAEAEAVLRQAGTVLGEPPADLARSAGDDLFENRLAQPLICAAELAAWAALRSRLPAPALIAGYSVGELAAYGCAGALSAGALLRLAMRRAALMDEAGKLPSGLLAIRGLPDGEIRALCAEFGAEIAIVNGADHFIVGAPLEALESLQPAALGRGAQTARRLRVAVAAHTSVLAGAGRQFRTALEQSDFSDPPVAVLAGVDGAPVRNRARAMTTLAGQLSSTVDWQACVKTALEMGCRVFLELGPGSGLTRMVRDLSPAVAARSVEEFRRLEGAADWVVKQLDRSS